MDGWFFKAVEGGISSVPYLALAVGILWVKLNDSQKQTNSRLDDQSRRISRLEGLFIEKGIKEKP